MKEAFGYADTNGNNLVGRIEFLEFFAKQGVQISGDAMEYYFRVFDKDHNSYFDFSEFLELTKKTHFIRERGQDEPMYFGRVVFALSWIHEKIDTSGIFCARQ